LLQSYWTIGLSSYLKEQAEPDPLVVLDVLLVPIVAGLVNSWMRNVNPDPLPVRRRERVCWMYPAVRVEHVLWNVSGVNTHDRCPDVLSGCDNEGEGQQGHDRDSVVKPEHGSIGVVATNLD